MTQIQKVETYQKQKRKLFHPFIKDQRERFSTYSHLGGMMLSVIGTILIGIRARGNPWGVFVGVFYGFTNIFTFFSSTMCHSQSLSESDWNVWAKLDEIAIFTLIAGTYTPMAYLFLPIKWMIGIISAQWVFAITGMTVKFFKIRTPRWFTATIYLVQGWMVAVCAHLVFRGWLALDAVLMAIGGLAYSIGTVFYITKKPKLWPGKFGPHDLWHIMVLIGATTFYIVIFRAI
jgi:hemolysin III